MMKRKNKYPTMTRDNDNKKMKNSGIYKRAYTLNRIKQHISEREMK